MKNKYMIGNSQHDLAKGKSYLINLVTFITRWTFGDLLWLALVDKDRATDITYPDICKAFDTVLCQITGLCPVTFQSSVTGKPGSKTCSQWLTAHMEPIMTGIPQGLLLWPILFNICVSSITQQRDQVYPKNLCWQHPTVWDSQHAAGKEYHPERPGQAWEMGQCKPCGVQ